MYRVIWPLSRIVSWGFFSSHQTEDRKRCHLFLPRFSSPLEPIGVRPATKPIALIAIAVIVAGIPLEHVIPIVTEEEIVVRAPEQGIAPGVAMVLIVAPERHRVSS